VVNVLTGDRPRRAGDRRLQIAFMDNLIPAIHDLCEFAPESLRLAIRLERFRRMILHRDWGNLDLDS
jgi:hypothetical protein